MYLLTTPYGGLFSFVITLFDGELLFMTFPCGLGYELSGSVSFHKTSAEPYRFQQFLAVFYISFLAGNSGNLEP